MLVLVFSFANAGIFHNPVFKKVLCLRLMTFRDAKLPTLDASNAVRWLAITGYLADKKPTIVLFWTKFE